jgi:hypothetical protein
MKHYLAFSILMMISLLMACCLTSAVQRLAPNLAGQAQTAVATQAEGLGQKLVETMLPSLDVSTLEAQAQTMMASALPAGDITTLEAQAQTLMATTMQGAGQQIQGTPQPAVPNSGGQAPAGVPADFPVTQDATNLKVLTTGAQAQIDYQTSMNLNEVIGFCTVKLTSAGWVLQPVMMSMTATNFSVAFSSSSNPADIVIQGVTVGNLTNVNVKYEVIK